MLWPRRSPLLRSTRLNLNRVLLRNSSYRRTGRSPSMLSIICTWIVLFLLSQVWKRTYTPISLIIPWVNARNISTPSLPRKLTSMSFRAPVRVSRCSQSTFWSAQAALSPESRTNLQSLSPNWSGLTPRITSSSSTNSWPWISWPNDFVYAQFFIFYWTYLYHRITSHKPKCAKTIIQIKLNKINEAWKKISRGCRWRVYLS